MITTQAAAKTDIEIAEFVGQFYADPYNFVRCCYPWKKKGPLETYDGPDTWQADLLKDIGREVRSRRFDGVNAVLPIRQAVSSGHGVGKSTVSGWLTNWIMSTRPHSQGTVTANTFPQLASKTWPAILKWTRMCVTSHWFETGASKIYAKASPDSWFVTAQTCRAENSEAFHGQHAARSTSWYLFDEASAIPDEIWAAAEGGLTDGEPMIVCFGNPTRNTGKFHRVVFGSERDRWRQRTIDSRECKFTNKELINEWVQDWGEDSDFVRVRVRGIAPRAGDLQFIPNDLVWEAQRRLPQSLPDDPLIAGFDVSGGGAAWNVISFRRGYDARSIPAIRIPGEHTKGSDRSAMVAKLAEVMSDMRPDHRVSMLFVDAAFGAPYVERLKSMGYQNVIEVSFGAPSPDRHCANMRAYMWSKLKNWLEHGAIDGSTVLENDLTGPGCDRNRSDKLVLESKADMVKRGVASPDWGDSLCFVRNTMVLTPRGPVPIEQINVGDEVVTPFGNSRVMVLHEQDAGALTTVRFSNGSSLTGTPNHEVFTFDSGPVRLDTLRLTDEVDTDAFWRRALWRLVSLPYTGVRNSGFKQLAGTINPGARQQRRDYFIAGCGLTLTGLFQRARLFITSMETGAITLFPTWNCRTLEATAANICSSGPQFSGSSGSSGWFKEGRRLLSGMDLLRGWRGIVTTGSAPGLAANQSRQSVSNAESDTKPTLLLAPVFAQEPVNRTISGRGGITSRIRERARIVAKSLWRTGIGRQRVVPVSVQTASVPLTRTYNLTLAEHNAYYANGILVFNCLTFAHHVAPPDPVIERLERFRGSAAGSWMG